MGPGDFVSVNIEVQNDIMDSSFTEEQNNMPFGLFKKKDKEPVKAEEVSPQGSERKKVFEDAFMDVQEGLIALCMELAGDVPVDDVYVYGSIEENAYSFNAFYVRQGQVLATHKVNEDLPIIKQFLQIGTHDLVRLEEVCREYDRPVPTELKLHYVVGGGLDAHYEYDPVCGSGSGRSPADVFRSWRESVEKELKKLN